MLDRGAVLLTALTQAVAEMEVQGRGAPPAADAWRELGSELAVFQGRLSLWFDERSEVAAAFAEAIRLTDLRTTWVGTLWAAEPQAGQLRTSSPERILAEFVVARRRYLSVARAHLRG